MTNINCTNIFDTKDEIKIPESEFLIGLEYEESSIIMSENILK